MKVVILGAGQTGRGLLARLAQLSGAEITLIDRDGALIDALNRRGRYRVVFFGGRRAPRSMEGFRALRADDSRAATRIAEADVLLTAVRPDNLESLVPLLGAARRVRGAGALQPLVACENGIAPAAVLEARLAGAYRFSNGCVLCTCVADGLDVRSQPVDELPYDILPLDRPLPLAGFVPEADYALIIRRKIYTYNCLSACIAYLGALKGCEVYARAAVDPDIDGKARALLRVLDRAICLEYGVSPEAQREFSQRALEKFQNPEIEDSIARNARDAVRKLGPEERLVAPMRLAARHGLDTGIFREMIAAAIAYDMAHEHGLDGGDLEGSIRKVCGIGDEETVRDIAQRVKNPGKRAIYADPAVGPNAGEFSPPGRGPA
jgi:mannitol-1-phosphate 5-dehydrogenase